MKKQLFILLAGASLLLSSCHRTSCEMWEDTKTCGRYIHKGLQSLIGQHIDSREYVYTPTWSEPTEFIPLPSEAHYSLTECEIPQEVSHKKPKDWIPSIEHFHDPSSALSSLFKNIHFDTDNYTVKGKENLEILQTITDHLKHDASLYLFIAGYADERGAAAYNLALGSRRANSVRNFLIQKGIDPERLFTVSYGKEKPIALEHNELAWQKNRRSEFKIYER